MFGATGSLLPIAPSGKRIRAFTLGVNEESLQELKRLLDTLGVEVVESVCASVRHIQASTYFGSGKLEECALKIQAEELDCAVIDVELSPNQLRNLEKALRVHTLDRAGVIIEIFSQHARTKEAKNQVELARVQYILPRLTHLWDHLDRQRGGGTGSRGMGEKQMEADRRMLKSHVSHLKTRLKALERVRMTQRGGRRDVLKVAFVGYTNAGKSTLLNAMTHSNVLAEDKLFATLDSSIRALDPDCHPPVVAIDTVGFIEHLPPSLVASFKSTLEEIRFADLLVHVVDASSDRAEQQYRVTDEILTELGVGETPRFVVMNKMDAVHSEAELNWVKTIAPGAIRISALREQDTERLRERILDHFTAEMELVEIVIPYGEGKLESQVRSRGRVETVRFVEKGTFMRVHMQGEWVRKLNLERYRT